MARISRYWQRTKELTWMLVVVIAACFCTYVIKDHEDSAYVGRLSDRIFELRKEKDATYAEANTRANQTILKAEDDYDKRLADKTQEFTARANDRDTQIRLANASLVAVLAAIHQGKQAREEAISTSQAAAVNSAHAASAADVAANAAVDTRQALRSATLPSALPPQPAKPWIGGNGH